MKRKRVWLWGALGLAAVLGVVRLWSGGGGEGGDGGDPRVDAGEKLFYDRMWLDAFPRNPTEEIAIFAAITEEPIGLFDKRSTWRGSWELFRYEPRGDGKVLMLFPQTGTKEDVTYRAVDCSDGGFDFCLELKGASHGVKRYYSRKGWELDGADSADALLDKVAALVAAP
ncbi:MAG TPA: hypothetical protein VG389_29490 [Myxococcota bacterium]|jgi:hypothetical protein|nr:hypothetical protein [Myxococcota bacterium]